MLTALWPGKYCSLLRRPRENGLHECYSSGGGATAAVRAGPGSGPLQDSGMAENSMLKVNQKPCQVQFVRLLSEARLFHGVNNGVKKNIISIQQAEYAFLLTSLKLNSSCN